MPGGFQYIMRTCKLPVKHSGVCTEFPNGSFLVHKMKRLFSSIMLDHAHEVNPIVKCEGGAVVLTKNPAALRRWMIAGSERARMVEEFK